MPQSANRLYIYDAKMEQAIKQVENQIHPEINHKRFLAVKLLENDDRFEDLNTYKIKNIQQQLIQNYDTDLEETIATERYQFIGQVKKQTVDKKQLKETISDQLDKVFLNKWLAFPIFIVIMFLVYYLSVGVVGSFTVDWVGAHSE